MYTSGLNEWLGFSFQLLLLPIMHWLRTVSCTARVARHCYQFSIHTHTYCMTTKYLEQHLVGCELLSMIQVSESTGNMLLFGTSVCFSFVTPSVSL